MGKKGEIKWFNTGIKWIVSRQVWVFSNRGYLILLYSMLFSCQVSLGNKKFFCGMFCCSKWLLSVKPPGFCSQARGRGFVVLLRKFWTIVRDLFLFSYCLSQRATRSFFPTIKVFFPFIAASFFFLCKLFLGCHLECQTLWRPYHQFGKRLTFYLPSFAPTPVSKVVSPYELLKVSPLPLAVVSLLQSYFW